MLEAESKIPSGREENEACEALRVSVVVPTLNESGRITALLDSLGAQIEAPPFEVLVVDGGSSDGTLELVSSWRDASASARPDSTSPRAVRALEAPRGVASQRNFGARAARGELLVFLDADDQAPPGFLRGVWRAFERWPFAVACPWFVARDAGMLTRSIYFGFNIGFFLGQSTLRMGSGVCLLVPRERFLACGGFDPALHLGEDIELIRRLCPRHGWHRHLLVPLYTSGRRFEHEGALRLLTFYARITPLLLAGRWSALQKISYPAAPYQADAPRQEGPETKRSGAEPSRRDRRGDGTSESPQ